MASEPVSLDDTCPSHPDAAIGEAHECMQDEARCVYCGAPVFCKCRDCGKFMTVEEMRDAATVNYRHLGSCP